MSKQVVEYDGVPVGITVTHEDGLKFIAVKYPVIELDGGFYRDIAELRSAIRTHLEKSETEDTFSVLAEGIEAANSGERNAFRAA